MAFGLYRMLAAESIEAGIYYLLSGAILLVIFIWMIVKEYEIIA